MKRILVVDDSSFVRSIMRRMLEGSEYTVVAEAADAKEALELYAAHRPDVVMLDLTLPGDDGLSTLEAIQAQNPAARVVIVSGLAQAPIRDDAMRRGARAFLAKPFELGSFKRVLAEALT